MFPSWRRDSPEALTSQGFSAACGDRGGSFLWETFRVLCPCLDFEQETPGAIAARIRPFLSLPPSGDEPIPLQWSLHLHE